MGHTWYGFLLTHWGWPAEGRAELDIAQADAPAKVTVYRMRGHTYYVERNFANAIHGIAKLLNLERTTRLHTTSSARLTGL